MTPEPLYYEAKVADALGIARPALSRIRADLLKKNRGWLMAGRDVALTGDGLEAVLKAIGESSNARVAGIDFSACLVAPDEKKEEVAAAGGVLELTVKRIYPNVRMLQAEDPGGNPVNVQVPSNKNFVVGMKLRGRPLREGWYILEGRCPRSRGRW
jgi:hypothetical protein